MTGEQQDARGGEELNKLNADDLDVEELDEVALEEAAGGACPTFSCDVYTVPIRPDQPPPGGGSGGGGGGGW